MARSGARAVGTTITALDKQAAGVSLRGARRWSSIALVAPAVLIALFVVGGANGQLAGNLHLRAAPGTPMANVMLDLIHRLGIDDMERFGDSTGSFSLSA